MVDFYNQRRAQLADVEPNKAHKIIANLEEIFDVVVITQNVDDLHERGGSSKIIHLHGELTKLCNEKNKKIIKDIGYTVQTYGETAPDNSLWRPFIVWFGEAVPMMEKAIAEVAIADYLIIIGTSLNVYPAANLYNYAPNNIPIWIIDPNMNKYLDKNITVIKEKATVGMEIVAEIISPNCLFNG